MVNAKAIRTLHGVRHSAIDTLLGELKPQKGLVFLVRGQAARGLRAGVLCLRVSEWAQELKAKLLGNR